MLARCKTKPNDDIIDSLIYLTFPDLKLEPCSKHKCLTHGEILEKHVVLHDVSAESWKYIFVKW